MDYSMLTPVISIFSAICGAVVGVVGNKYVSRAKIRIDIHGIFLNINSVDTNNKEDGSNRKYDFFEVPSQIVNIFESCEHLNLPERYYNDPLEYREFLLEAKNELIKKKYEFEEIPEILKQMEILLNTNMKKDFLKYWFLYQKVFWPYLLMAYDSKKFTLDIDILECLKDLDNTCNISEYEAAVTHEQVGEQEEQKQEIDLDELVHQVLGSWDEKIRKDENDNYFIVIDSNKIITFPTFKFDDSDLKIFSYKIAFFLITENTRALKNIIKYLKSINWNDPYFNVLKDTIENELKGFRRIAIKGMFVNPGKSPLAISGRGVLMIESEGFKYRVNQSSEEVDVINHDIAIPINIINEKNNFKNAIVINAGEAIPFEANSCYHFRDMKQELSTQIENLYNMEKKCLVRFLRLDSREYVMSNKINFRDLNDDYFNA